MAKQESIITLNGAIGNISFFKTKDGYNARLKTGVSKEKIMTDPRYARTRENMAEFGRAANAAKLLRDALLDSVNGSSDGKMPARLQKAMMEVLKTDASSDRGQRNVLDGETELLAGFEFNTQAPLSNTLLAAFTTSAVRATGVCELVLPEYDPAKMLRKPNGATHYRFGLTVAAVDFENAVREVQTQQSAWLQVDAASATASTLSVTLAPGSTHPLFMALTIEFVQETNGRKYPMNNGAFNACALVKVDGGV